MAAADEDEEGEEGVVYEVAREYERGSSDNGCEVGAPPTGLPVVSQQDQRVPELSFSDYLILDLALLI